MFLPDSVITWWLGWCQEIGFIAIPKCRSWRRIASAYAWTLKKSKQLSPSVEKGLFLPQTDTLSCLQICQQTKSWLILTSPFGPFFFFNGLEWRITRKICWTQLNHHYCSSQVKTWITNINYQDQTTLTSTSLPSSLAFLKRTHQCLLDWSNLRLFSKDTLG